MQTTMNPATKSPHRAAHAGVGAAEANHQAEPPGADLKDAHETADAKDLKASPKELLWIQHDPQLQWR